MSVLENRKYFYMKYTSDQYTKNKRWISWTTRAVLEEETLKYWKPLKIKKVL